MKVVIEAFDKESELIAFETEVGGEYLQPIFDILKLDESDIEFLLCGAGGFDISASQLQEISSILAIPFDPLSHDFQLGTG